MVKFNEITVGTIFKCKDGMFKKLREYVDKYTYTAVSVNFPVYEKSIHGSTLCEVIKL